MENRRSFLIKSGLLSAATLTNVTAFSGINKTPEEFNGKIMTVLDPIDPKELGVCLTHEHIISRFGEDPEETPVYDYKKAVNDIVPYLKYMKKIGCNSIVCCTTKYFGRDAELLRKVSKESGVNVITNTGFYGAAGDRYVPQKAFKLSANNIADIWIDEFISGIAGSDIRPGIIKIGIDDGPVSDIDAKLIRAAALCHRKTGLTIQVHTGDNLPAVKSQLEILTEEGVSPKAWIWIHAQNVSNEEDLLYAAKKGAWISLDALRTTNYYEQRTTNSITVDRHLELLEMLKKQGYLNQVLLSHDGSSYPQEGKSKRSFDVLFTTFIPMMKSAGFTDIEIEQLIIANPMEALTIKKRLL